MRPDVAEAERDGAESGEHACRQAHCYGIVAALPLTGTPRSTTTRPAIAPPTKPDDDRWKWTWKRDASGGDGFVDEANVTTFREGRESRGEYLRAHADIHRRQPRELQPVPSRPRPSDPASGRVARAARRGLARWTRVDEPTTDGYDVASGRSCATSESRACEKRDGLW